MFIVYVILALLLTFDAATAAGRRPALMVVLYALQLTFDYVTFVNAAPEFLCCGTCGSERPPGS